MTSTQNDFEAVNDRGRVFPFDKDYLKFYLAAAARVRRGAQGADVRLVIRTDEELFPREGGLDWLLDTPWLFGEHNVNWSFGPYRDDDSGVSDNPEALRILSAAAEQC